MSTLPEEVLVVIFGFLVGNKDNSDLLNATLICKRWNQIISQSAFLMDQLKLSINLKMLNDDELRSFKLSRPYRHATSEDGSWHFVDKKNLKFMRKLTLEGNHQQLTSLKFKFIIIFPETIRRISFCKHLRILILTICRLNMDGEHDVSKLTSLRKLELNDTPTTFLNHIECNQLDSLKVTSASDHDNSKAGPNLFKFFNQLDRCDEIDMYIYNWNFDVNFQPKFLWSKLKLHCSGNEGRHDRFYYDVLNSAAVRGIEILCKASKENAESEIHFSEFPIEYGRLWIAILNSCKVIKHLSISATTMPILPVQLNLVRSLSEVRTVQIDAEGLGDETFANFTRKLPNVTSLIIRPRSGGVRITNESELLLLNSFFDHIDEMRVGQSHFVQTSLQHPAPSHFLRINIENLKKLTIDGAVSPRPYVGRYYNVKPICEQNRNLHHIDVKIDRQWLIHCKNQFLIDWYSELRETPVKTCNIAISPETGMHFPLINWRKTNMSEMELFGKVLDEEENRFFV